MSKPLKIVLAVLSALVLLLVAAAVALPLLFDPNDFRGRIATLVQQKTGRSFVVGDIQLRVFPWLRVQLGDVKLGNADGFGTEPMLSVQRADVGVRLLPLLREKRVEASTLTLQGVTARLAVDAQGRNNWQDLQQHAQQTPDDPSGKDGAGSTTLDIEGIDLSQLNLQYDDARSGAYYELSDARFKTGRLLPGASVPVEGALRFGSRQPAASGTLAFAATLTLDTAQKTLTLGKPTLKLEASKTGATAAEALAATLTLSSESLRYDQTKQLLEGEPLKLDLQSLRLGSEQAPALRGTLKLTTMLTADLAQQQFQLADLKTALDLATPTMQVKGSLQGQANAAQARQQYRLDNLDARLDISGAGLPGGKSQTVQLNTSLLADLAAHEARLAPLQVRAAGLTASARQWRVQNLGAGPMQLDGDLSLAAFSPRSLLATLGIAVPTTADANVLKSASLDVQLSATPTTAALKSLVLKLDDTTLRGEVAVRNFASKALRFDLKGDRLDVDRYLPPVAAASDSPVPTTSAKKDVNATELPVKALDALNAQGAVQLASLKLKGLRLANASWRLSGTPGSPHRQQFSVDLYGGHAELALSTSVTPRASHALKLGLTGINAAPLLKDAIGKDSLSGKGTVNIDVTAAGLTIGELRRALNGNLSFAFTDGAVKGFNLGKTIRDGQNLLRAQAATASDEPQSTDFAELRGSGVITNGVLKSDQLSAKNPLLRLEGAGEIDLANETINYLAKPVLVGTATGQGGKELANLAGIVVPVRLSGNLFKPKVAIDWQAALQQQAATKLRENLGVSNDDIKQQREKLKQKAAEQLNKGLMRLFGNQPTPANPDPSTPAPAPAGSP